MLSRCAVCGSTSVRRTEENEGYSYKKGIAGTIVFGAIGAVAGINGKKTTVYKCGHCGHTMHSTLNESTCKRIDDCFRNHDYMMWKTLKSVYPGIADMEAPRKPERVSSLSQHTTAFGSRSSGSTSQASGQPNKKRTAPKSAFELMQEMERRNNK